jgi:hypothetical protein
VETDKMIRLLHGVKKEYRGKRIGFGETNIVAMCEDIVPKLEQLKSYEDAEEQGLLTKVAHGHWSLVAFSRGIKVCKCSVCNNNQYGSTQYCGNCGAKMDGEEAEKKLAEMQKE